MMKRAILYFTVLFVLQQSRILRLQFANASEKDFKHSVIDDCETAKKLLTTLTEVEKDEAVNYLLLVLKMEVPLFEQAMPTVRSATTTNLFSVEDPNREKNAKMCALDVLGQIPSLAIKILPELLELLEDKRFSLIDNKLEEDLRKLVEEETKSLLIFELVEAQRIKIANAVIPFLVKSTKEEALQIVINLKNIGLNALVYNLRTPTLKLRDAIAANILRLDANGEATGESIVALLKSEDEDLRIRAINLLSKMPEFYNKSINPILQKLQDVSEEVQNKAALSLADIFSSIADVKILFEKTPFEESGFNLLISKWNTSSGEVMKALSEVIVKLSKKYKNFNDHFINEYLTASDTKRKLDALKVLGQLQTLSDKGYGVLKEASFFDEPQIRLVALEGLGFQKERSKQTIDIFLKLLKSPAFKKGEYVRLSLLNVISKSLYELNVGKEALALTPYILETLDTENMQLIQPINNSSSVGLYENPQFKIVAEVLKRMATDVVPILNQNLQKGSELAQVRIIKILSQFIPPSSVTIKNILGLLSSEKEKVRLASRNALIAYGKIVEVEVKKLINSKNLNTRTLAGEILYVLGSRDSQVALLFEKGFKEAICDEQIALFESFVKADSSGNLLKPDAFILLQLTKCTENSNPVVRQKLIEKLITFNPLPQDVLDLLATKVTSPNVDLGFKFLLLDFAKELGLPPELVYKPAQELLNSEDSSIRYRAISIFAKLGDQAKGVLPTLISIADNTENGDLMRFQAVLAIVKISPADYDYKNFFISQLSYERLNWIKKSMKELATDVGKEIPESIFRDVAADEGNPKKDLAKAVIEGL